AAQPRSPRGDRLSDHGAGAAGPGARDPQHPAQRHRQGPAPARRRHLRARARGRPSRRSLARDPVGGQRPGRDLRVVDIEPLRRRLAVSGAWLFAVGMVTGLWAAAVLTERVSVGLPRLALAAHLNALLGGMWLVLVASTLDML